MDVVVAGGSGLLGRALCGALVQAGHRVAILSRDPSRTSGIDQRIETVAWDPTRSASDQAWVERLARADAIVNLAGENVGGRGPLPARWTPDFKRSLRGSRLGATHAIVGALAATPARSRPGVLVNASAIGFYGSRGDELLTESSAPGTDFFGTLCVEWEAAVRAVEECGVRVVVVRTGVVLDCQAMAAKLLVLASRCGVGGPLGSGQQWWSWIHRDDVVGLIMHALGTESVRGPMNVVAPNPRRMADFPRVLGKLLHRPSVVPTPAFALRLVFGEVADALLLASQRVVPERALETGYVYRYPTLEQALQVVVGASAPV
ncbi:MAG: TIGR01777 family oxidoreductase [Chloroflexi bacterium]|nr:TIGR01777 family oxidoreductase [Chloroflexota bacterium]